MAGGGAAAAVVVAAVADADAALLDFKLAQCI